MSKKADERSAPGNYDLPVAKKLIEAIDAETTSDADAGRRLLAARLASEAESRGMNPMQIPPELAERWVASMRVQEADSEENSSVEKAIHLAANGAFERAGQILKGFLVREAGTQAAFEELRTGSRRQSENAKKPRPGRVSKLKTQVVAEMAKARARNEDMNTFLFSAENGSIGGLRIRRLSHHPKDKFSIETDDEIETRGSSTLEAWWTKAAS